MTPAAVVSTWENSITSEVPLDNVDTVTGMFEETATTSAASEALFSSLSTAGFSQSLSSTMDMSSDDGSTITITTDTVYQSSGVTSDIDVSTRDMNSKEDSTNVTSTARQTTAWASEGQTDGNEMSSTTIGEVTSHATNFLPDVSTGDKTSKARESTAWTSDGIIDEDKILSTTGSEATSHVTTQYPDLSISDITLSSMGTIVMRSEGHTDENKISTKTADGATSHATTLPPDLTKGVSTDKMTTKLTSSMVPVSYDPVSRSTLNPISTTNPESDDTTSIGVVESTSPANGGQVLSTTIIAVTVTIVLLIVIAVVLGIVALFYKKRRLQRSNTRTSRKISKVKRPEGFAEVQKHMIEHPPHVRKDSALSVSIQQTTDPSEAENQPSDLDLVEVKCEDCTVQQAEVQQHTEEESKGIGFG